MPSRAVGTGVIARERGFLRLSLRGWTAKLALALAALLIAGTYTSVVARHYAYSRIAGSPSPESLELATRLAPGDAAAWNRLGKHRLLAEQAPVPAVEALARATKLNPYSSRYWLDLSLASLAAGDDTRYLASVDKAVKADPTNPDVLWEAANMYLAVGQFASAAPLLRVISQHEPNRLPQILLLAWRATHDMPRIAAELLEGNPTGYANGVRYFAQIGKLEVADSLWAGLLQSQRPFSGVTLLPYIEKLLQQHRPEDAFQVWSESCRRDPAMAVYRGSGNLIVNGGFELDPVGGFDWHLESRPHIDIGITTEQHHSGSRSLAINFDGEPVSILPLWQFAVVEPNTAYELSAYMRTDALLSTSGLRFIVVDGYGNARLLVSDDILGSEDWKRVAGRFTTGPQTRLVVIWAGRVPPDSGITGHVWIDDLSLQKAN